MGLTLLDEKLINKTSIRKAWESGSLSKDFFSQIIDLCIYDSLFVAQLLQIANHNNHEQIQFIADHLMHHLAPYKKFISPQGVQLLNEIKAWALLSQHRKFEKLAEEHLVRIPSKMAVWLEQIHDEERKLFLARAEISRIAC